jgi:hypothetical protein
MSASLGLLLPVTVLSLFYIHAFRSEDMKPTLPPRIEPLRYFDIRPAGQLSPRARAKAVFEVLWLLRWLLLFVATAASALTLTIVHLLG